MKRDRPTLLVVDDEPDLREALKTFFEMINFTVLCAGSGNTAFNLLQQEAVDIVLSDVRMPDGDGTELLQELRRQGNQVPFVLMTGFADVSREKAKQMAATE